MGVVAKPGIRYASPHRDRRDYRLHCVQHPKPGKMRVSHMPSFHEAKDLNG